MKLYSGPLSMFGAKTEIAAIEKGLDIDVEHVPFSLERLYYPKHEEVLRVNPKAEVPILIDDSVELYDSTQIFEYFETRFPQPVLWPEAPAERARARQLELWSDEVFFAKVIALMPKNLEGKTPTEIKQIQQDIAADYAMVNQWLEGRQFLVAQFSYADIAFCSALFFASFIAIAPDCALSSLSKWRMRMSERDSVQRTLGSMVTYLAEYGIDARLS